MEDVAGHQTFRSACPVSSGEGRGIENLQRLLQGPATTTAAKGVHQLSESLEHSGQPRGQPQTASVEVVPKFIELREQVSRLTKTSEESSTRANESKPEHII